MNKLYKHKVFATIVSTIVIAVLLASGCAQDNGSSGNNSDNSDNGDNGVVALSGTVTTAGSTSVQPLSDELAQAFMAENPDVRIEVSGGGSSAGVKAAQNNTVDFGAASRNLKDSETGVEALTIARDGIAVIVNPENEVSELTFEQIQKIFTGEITNWSEVGGSNAEMVIVNREEGSGTRGAFHELVVGEDNAFTEEAIIQNSNGAVREAVSQDVNAIGFMSLGGVNDTVKPVKVDGVEPTIENIKADKYPIARPLNYVLNENNELSKVAQAYIDFVLSDEGQAIVTDMGYIDVK